MVSYPEPKQEPIRIRFLKKLIYDRVSQMNGGGRTDKTKKETN